MQTIGLTSIDFWVDTGVTIAGLFAGAVATTVYAIKKHKNAKQNAKQEYHKEPEFDPNFEPYAKHSTIHEMLTSLRLQLNADRVQIAQFHNGGKFLEGTPMKKFSVTYESCGPGVSMEYSNLQNILTSLFWCLIDIVKENDGKVRLTRTLQQDSYLKAYNESKNIQAFSVVPVKKQELYMGFVRAEWNNIHDIPDDYDDCERLMDKYRSFIELEMMKG